MYQLLKDRKSALVKALRDFDKRKCTNVYFYDECDDLSSNSVCIEHNGKWENNCEELFTCVKKVLADFDGLSVYNEHGKLRITVDFTQEEMIDMNNEYFENEGIETEDEELEAFITSDKKNKGDLITFFGNLESVVEICINAKTDYMLPNDNEVSIGLRFNDNGSEFSTASVELSKSVKFNICLV